MHKIITITGRSGCGKSTVERMLEKNGFTRVISHTSREPRSGEIDGVNYYFSSVDEMEDMKLNNEFLELTEYNGNMYGASKNEIETKDVIVIEPVGLKTLKENLADRDDILMISVFLYIDEETSRQRMEERGDSKESIDKRIENDNKLFSDCFELLNQNFYDYIINAGEPVDSVARAIQNIYEVTNNDGSQMGYLQTALHMSSEEDRYVY